MRVLPRFAYQPKYNPAYICARMRSQHLPPKLTRPRNDARAEGQTGERGAVAKRYDTSAPECSVLSLPTSTGLAFQIALSGVSSFCARTRQQETSPHLARAARGAARAMRRRFAPRPRVALAAHAQTYWEGQSVSNYSVTSFLLVQTRARPAGAVARVPPCGPARRRAARQQARRLATLSFECGTAISPL